MIPTDTILDRIMTDVRREVAEAKRQCPLDELQRRLADAPPVRSLKAGRHSAKGRAGFMK